MLINHAIIKQFIVHFIRMIISDFERFSNTIYFVLVADQQSIVTNAIDTDESQYNYNVGELISFASFDVLNDTNLQDQTADVSKLKAESKID